MKTVIIGASHAGIAFAEAMRRNGFDGSLCLVDRLAGAPLERPPLSKRFLGAGDGDDDGFALRKPDWYTDNDITLIERCDIVQLDVEGQSLRTADGDAISYDRLVIASGAVPRRLGMAKGLDGVFELRNPDDARALRAAASAAKSLVVIGGGYIGLEVSASLRGAGRDVCVIEAADRLLARVASPEISRFFEELHTARGVEVITGATVEGIVDKAGQFTGAGLAGGRRVDADFLVVGIGVVPDSGLAETAGIETDNGVLVDDSMRTSNRHVYAIGDVARIRQSAGRIESVHNAQHTAECAAAAINGHAPPADQAPWFWSEQYDARLQSAGIVPGPGADNPVHVRRPGKREGGFSVWSFAGQRLCAVEAVRDPAGYMLGKTLLESGAAVRPEQAGDATFDLKALLTDKSVA